MKYIYVGGSFVDHNHILNKKGKVSNVFFLHKFKDGVKIYE